MRRASPTSEAVQEDGREDKESFPWVIPFLSLYPIITHLPGKVKLNEAKEVPRDSNYTTSFLKYLCYSLFVGYLYARFDFSNCYQC